jgi:hypothetical protein
MSKELSRGAVPALVRRSIRPKDVSCFLSCRRKKLDSHRKDHMLVELHGRAHGELPTTRIERSGRPDGHVARTDLWVRIVPREDTIQAFV